jgi:hypothetical protein
MIVFSRGAAIAPGKIGSAMAFAHQVSAYLKTTYGIELEVLMPVGGNPNRIGWSTRYADLAAMEVATTKMTADPKYWEIVNAGAANFIAGSIRDSIWRTV